MYVGYKFAHHFKERKDIFFLKHIRDLILLSTKQLIRH